MNFLRFNWNFTEHNELLFSENTIKGFSRNLIKCNQLHCMKIYKKNAKKFVCNIISTKTFIVAIKTGPQHKFLIASIQNIVLRLLWLHIKCLTANNFVSVCVLLIFHWNQQKFMTKIHEKNGFKGEREWGKKTPTEMEFTAEICWLKRYACKAHVGLYLFIGLSVLTRRRTLPRSKCLHVK